MKNGYELQFVQLQNYNIVKIQVKNRNKPNISSFITPIVGGGEYEMNTVDLSVIQYS